MEGKLCTLLRIAKEICFELLKKRNIEKHRGKGNKHTNSVKCSKNQIENAYLQKEWIVHSVN